MAYDRYGPDFSRRFADRYLKESGVPELAPPPAAPAPLHDVDADPLMDAVTATARPEPPRPAQLVPQDLSPVLGDDPPSTDYSPLPGVDPLSAPERAQAAGLGVGDYLGAGLSALGDSLGNLSALYGRRAPTGTGESAVQMLQRPQREQARLDKQYEDDQVNARANADFNLRREAEGQRLAGNALDSPQSRAAQAGLYALAQQTPGAEHLPPEAFSAYSANDINASTPAQLIAQAAKTNQGMRGAEHTQGMADERQALDLGTAAELYRGKGIALPEGADRSPAAIRAARDAALHANALENTDRRNIGKIRAAQAGAGAGRPIIPEGGKIDPEKMAKVGITREEATERMWEYENALQNTDPADKEKYAAIQKQRDIYKTYSQYSLGPGWRTVRMPTPDNYRQASQALRDVQELDSIVSMVEDIDFEGGGDLMAAGVQKLGRMLPGESKLDSKADAYDKLQSIDSNVTLLIQRLAQLGVLSEGDKATTGGATGQIGGFGTILEGTGRDKLKYYAKQAKRRLGSVMPEFGFVPDKEYFNARQAERAKLDAALKARQEGGQ